MAPDIPHLISTVDELKTRLRTPFTLLSMDIEGERDHVSEVGLAVCSRLKPMQKPGTYASFNISNELRCRTIQLRDLSTTCDRRAEPLSLR
jgi:hypothetical protein